MKINQRVGQTTIPVREILRSKWFDNIPLLAEDEIQLESVISFANSEALTLQNAIRIAIALVKAFAECCDDGLFRQSVDSVSLDDVFVNFSDCWGADVREKEPNDAATPTDFKIKANPDDTTTKNNARHKSPVEDILRTGFFSSFDDKAANEYEAFFAKGVNVKSNEGTQVDHSRDAVGVELGLGYFSRLNHASENQESPLELSNEDLAAKTNSKNISINPVSTQRTLLCVDIISPTPLNQGDLNQNHGLDDTRKFQVLGCLLYSVFSRGNDPPPHYYPTNLNLQLPNDDIDIDSGVSHSVAGRKSKSPRPEENTIFYHLLSSKSYPVSICRFLSDMIDIGPKGKASDPFKSFDDITDDLKNMKDQPHLFLYDSATISEGSMPNSPLFGRQYHGRTKELTQFLDIPTRLEQQQSTRAEAIFVSGRSGSGKSHLVNTCGDFLSMQGWIVVSQKFERGVEHKSQGVVCSLFNKIVTMLIRMKLGQNQQDIEYSDGAVRMLKSSLDINSLCSLAEYLPDIQNLIEGVVVKRSSFVEANLCHWKLVFLLTEFTMALLKSNRPIMLILDDLQWADSLTLDLVLQDLLGAVGERIDSHNFLLAGLYRDDEVLGDHPLHSQLVRIHQSKRVTVTDIRLSAFSKVDLSEMIAAELRLPTRVVSDLSDFVHKKTSGHILFAVELLNSMVRDSIIHFNLKSRRYDWLWDRVLSIKTDDSIAGFIVSNLSTLTPITLQALRILSCFGFHVDLSVLNLLDMSSVAPNGGFQAPLLHLVDIGVIDMAGGLITFSHDLIQQNIYEDIELAEKNNLHYDIGVFLGFKASPALAAPHVEAVQIDMSQLYISDSKHSAEPIMSTRSLLSIAVDHINHAGPEFITQQQQRTTFAAWNLIVGEEFSSRSRFGCALHYYEEGIRFLGKGTWINDVLADGRQLCLGLYEGAAAACSAIGNDAMTAHYTNIIFQNVSPEKRLPAWISLFSSLESSGKHMEIVEKGIKLMRQFNINISHELPTPEAIMESMTAAATSASHFNSDQIVEMYHSRSDQKMQNIFKIYNAISVAAYSLSSPHLPLLTFDFVRYSLENKFCTTETAVAFASFGLFKIYFIQDYAAGKYWADIVLDMLKKARARSAYVRAKWIVYGHIMIWFLPLKITVKNLLQTYHLGSKIGDFNNSMYPLVLATSYALFEGENLALLSLSCTNNLKMMMKYNITCAKFAVIDKVMIDTLRGEDTNPFSIFGGLYVNDEDLINHAHSENNMNLLEYIYLRRFILSFWKDDYEYAETCSKVALSFPSANWPKLLSIYFTFFRGLIAFQLYRETQSEEHLRNGIEAICKFEVWVKLSPSNFENKLTLLIAEQQASLPNIEQATVLYKESIESARSNGRVHEQGLAYEMMGKFLLSVANESTQGMGCFEKARTCYNQWGAFEKAEILCRQYGLVAVDSKPSEHSLKRDRSS